jgi:hypothetical protein
MQVLVKMSVVRFNQNWNEYLFCGFRAVTCGQIDVVKLMGALLQRFASNAPKKYYR